MSTLNPPKPPPPPPARPAIPTASKQAPPARSTSPAKSFSTNSGINRAAEKIVIYGPGGVGKTELASLLGAVGIKPLFVDLEDGSKYLDVDRVSPSPETWDELRLVLRDQSILSGFNAVVIDSLTKAEELAVAHTVATVPDEKGLSVESIEGYGWGKGYVHVYETFLQLLGDLDAVTRLGLHVICIAHECTSNVPNPAGPDWIRYEPRMQSPASGKASIRHRVKEWCDHLLFVGFDTVVSKDGKAIGSGTRTIYPTEMPTHWAKSRSLSMPIFYERGSSALWSEMQLKGSK